MMRIPALLLSTAILFISLTNTTNAIFYSLQKAAFERDVIAPVLRRQKAEIAALNAKEAKAKDTIDPVMAARRAEQLARYRTRQEAKKFFPAGVGIPKRPPPLGSNFHDRES